MCNSPTSLWKLVTGVLAQSSWRLGTLPFIENLANIHLPQRGDQAIAGQNEDLPSHIFPSVAYDRIIAFKGRYLSIFNRTTNHYAQHLDYSATDATTEHTEYKVPAGYHVFVRGAEAYMKL